MNIILNTSFRSRGKWGDYLVTLIPLSWCLNILLNSNFILRMIEWQSESGAILIRIHGKQWYWVYKYDATSVFSALNLQKNVGTNTWETLSSKESNLTEKYIQTVFLKNKLSTQQEYWSDVINKEFNITSTFGVLATLQRTNNFIATKAPNISINETTQLVFSEPSEEFDFEVIEDFSEDSLIETNDYFIDSFDNDVDTDYSYFMLDLAECDTDLAFDEDSDFDATDDYSNFNFYQPDIEFDPTIEVNENAVELFSLENGLKNPTNTDFMDLHNKDITNKNQYFYENASLDDVWEVYSNVHIYDATQPIRFLLAPIKHNYYNDFKNLFKIKFLDSNEIIVEKPEENVEFLVTKQKRYKRKQNISNYSLQQTNNLQEFMATKAKNATEQSARFLKNNSFFQQISNLGVKSSFDFYTTIKLHRTRAESFSINLSRRLLRTTRTLVLPAFTNISIIANSYDVVHSWFIPGLGIKIDCVPGKSTHHSLYIDNVGLYYGQCAEICGRYHHHMPIRICALPFDHFLVWWTSKGLPKALKMKYDSKNIEQSLLVKYIW